MAKRGTFLKSAFLVFVAGAATACSLSSSRQAYIRISLPAAQAPRFATSSLLAGTAPASALSATGLADFQCFGVNVTGPEIAPNPLYPTCSGPDLPYVGIQGGFAPIDGGTIDLEVPAGVQRLVQLYAVETQPGLGCPSITNEVMSRFGSPEISTPVLVGSATTDVLGDTSVTIRASFDPANPRPMDCAGGTVPPIPSPSPSPSPSPEPAVATHYQVADFSGNSASSTQYVGACKELKIVTLDASNSQVPVSSAFTVQLGTTPASGGFFSDANCLTPVTSVTIPVASDSGMFYFKDNAQETFSLALTSASPLTFDGHSVTVLPALVAGEIPTSVAVHSGYVYWSDSIDWGALTSSVKKVLASGGTVTTLASNIAYTASLAVDSVHVYWMDNGSLNRVPVGGGTVIPLASGYSTNIVVDATDVYFAFSPSGIQKVPTSGGSTVVIEPETVVGAAPFAIALNASEIFWTNWGGALRKIPLGGGTISDLGTGIYASALAATSTHVYWADFNGISRIPVSGGASERLASGQAKCFAMDGTFIYWADMRNVWKTPLDGGTSTVLQAGLETSYSQNGSVSSYCLAVDATSVYLAAKTGLYKIPK
ncbi:MAG: hypothetical protein NDJ89_02590 [Oligoflexia bacterium]|nr:hypothetical protein [Oligoflexia bacterium]